MSIVDRFRPSRPVSIGVSVQQPGSARNQTLSLRALPPSTPFGAATDGLAACIMLDGDSGADARVPLVIPGTTGAPFGDNPDICRCSSPIPGRSWDSADVVPAAVGDTTC